MNMPDSISIQINEALHLAFLLHKTGSLAEAEMLYCRILDAAPETLDALHYLGMLCHQDKRMKEAVELIGRIIALDPANADAHNNLGNVYEGIGDDGTAEIYFRKAIELNPEHAPAYNNLGVVLAEQSRLDEAIEAYRQAIKNAPDTAEFHYNLGNALRRNAAIEESIDAYKAATAISPDHFGAWQGLARMLRFAGRQDEAVTVFDNLLRMNPGNPTFSYLRSACIGDNTPDRAPDSYVQQIFDDASGYFDKHLEGLEYRAPELLSEAIAVLLSPPEKALDILDAGCGTGLCGALLRPYALKLVGVDLSEGMLHKAAARCAYDDLFKGELTNFLERNKDSYDVIISADTLCYFGALEVVFAGSAGALKEKGLLAFTLEEGGEGKTGFLLNSTGRYSHARDYVEKSLLAAGFVIETFTTPTLRNEGKHPVTGHLVVARKS
ncbi:MAG: tetratricopeptide repeat protein [Desulfuromonadaceae bacterium]